MPLPVHFKALKAGHKFLRDKLDQFNAKYDEEQRLKRKAEADAAALAQTRSRLTVASQQEASGPLKTLDPEKAREAIAAWEEEKKNR